MPETGAAANFNSAPVPTVKSFLWALPSQRFPAPTPPPAVLSEGGNYLTPDPRSV